MARIRTVPEAYALLKNDDPDTRVTVSLLRRLIANGTIPSINSGRKIYLNYDVLLEYFSRPCGSVEDVQQMESGAIRPVPVRVK